MNFLILATVLVASAYAAAGIVSTPFNTFTGSVSQIQWVNDDVGIIITTTGEAYRTYNGGYAWALMTLPAGTGSCKDVSTKVGWATIPDKSEALSDHKDFDKYVLLAGSDKIIWVSNDTAKTMTPLCTDIVPESGSFNPDYADHIMIAGLSSECTHGTGYPGCRRQLYRSNSYLGSFGLSADFVEDYYWTGENPTMSGSRAAVATLWDSLSISKDAQPFGKLSSKMSLADVDTGSSLVVLDHVISMYKHLGYVYATTYNPKDSPHPQLYMRDNMYFEPVTLPENLSIFSPSAFHFYSSTNKTRPLYLTAETQINEDGTPEAGALLVAGVGGYSFTKVLDNIKISVQSIENPDHIPELTEVGSVIGVMLANVAEPSTVGVRPTTTKISSDGGFSWHTLKAPVNDYSGRPLSCVAPECSLHLNFIEWDSKQRPEAPSSARGVVVAIGNTGSSLNEDVAQMKTYVSYDAGETWSETHRTPMHTAVGDFGGVLALTKAAEATSGLEISVDGGANFESFSFLPTAESVISVHTTPSLKSRSFLVNVKSSTNVHYVVHVNAESILSRECGSADMEMWSPFHEGTEDDLSCVLGVQASYLRKKPSAVCYNPTDYSTPVTIVPCPCTNEDYMCSSGFTGSRSDDGLHLVCSALPNTVITGEPSYCMPYLTWSPTNPFSRIQGDHCDPNADGAVNRDTQWFVCPAEEKDTSLSGAAVAVIILCVVFVAILVGLCVVAKKRGINVIDVLRRGTSGGHVHHHLPDTLFGSDDEGGLQLSDGGEDDAQLLTTNQIRRAAEDLESGDGEQTKAVLLVEKPKAPTKTVRWSDINSGKEKKSKASIEDNEDENNLHDASAIGGFASALLGGDEADGDTPAFSDDSENSVSAATPADSNPFATASAATDPFAALASSTPATPSAGVAPADDLLL